MSKKLFFIIFVFLFLSATAEAAKKTAPAPGPSATQQQEFMQKYYEAMDGGSVAFKKFESETNNKPGDQGTAEAKMLANMKNGKAPDGGELKGFRGDPNDPGPTDWSNWNIETDANGNVTGFKEKDLEGKDTDKDGKISDAEREAWNKKKKEEHDAAGGAPGEVDNPPDWDKDRDGKPDPGFSLDCYQCVKGVEPPDDDIGCIGENADKCQAFCESKGYSSDPKCGGQCKQGPCIAIDVDKNDGRIVPSMQTRAKGSTQKCFTCMKVTEIEVEYIVIIIETPRGRVILGNPLSTLTNPGMLGFSPQKVMALATPNNPAIANFENIAQMAGGKLTKYSAGDVAGILSNMLNKKKGNNPDDCFKDFQNPPAWKGEPPSSGAVPRKSKKKDKSEEPAAPVSFGEDAATDIVVDGPVIACGTKDGEPALAVFDSHGANAQVIDRKTLSADPKAILNGIQKAQGFYQRISAIIQNPVQALTQEGMSLFSQKITERREPEDSKAKPKKKKVVIEPNDPLYLDKVTADKKAWKPHVTFGGGSSIMEQMAGGAGPEKDPDAYDQWYLRTIGYTPKSDKNSAWNVFTPAEPNVTVAVIDSGVDMQHVDGPQYIWKNTGEVAGNGIDDDGNGFVDDVHGWNFLDDTPDFPDYKGHGTAVAGIIAAQSNNDIGIAGINPGAVIMPLKAADQDGNTNSLAIYRAINYAVDQGANIINISLGGRGISALEQSAVSYARSKGVLVVVASGNTGEYLPNIGPAAMRGVIAVGMINMDGTRSPVSSSGANNGLLAPGEGIISLKSKESFKLKVDSVKHKEYFQQDGTSFAAPMVTATASLILAKNPQYTDDDLETILLGTAQDMDDAGWDETTGAGLLDAAAALRTAPENVITVVVSGIEIHRKETKGPVEYVDVYGTVRGPFKDYSVGLGKGKRAGGFKKVSSVYTESAKNKWLARIPSGQLNGSEDWVVQIAATPAGKDAKPKTARAYFSTAQ
jgi:hypothetical protein